MKTQKIIKFDGGYYSPKIAPLGSEIEIPFSIIISKILPNLENEMKEWRDAKCPRCGSFISLPTPFLKWLEDKYLKKYDK